jgi:hypothetical protein
MSAAQLPDDALGREQVFAAAVPEGEDPKAWEMVSQGRYMPRRIRGSFRGRELG